MEDTATNCNGSVRLRRGDDGENYTFKLFAAVKSQPTPDEILCVISFS